MFSKIIVTSMPINIYQIHKIISLNCVCVAAYQSHRLSLPVNRALSTFSIFFLVYTPILKQV